MMTNFNLRSEIVREKSISIVKSFWKRTSVTLEIMSTSIGVITISDLKLYCRAIVIKTIQHGIDTKTDVLIN